MTWLEDFMVNHWFNLYSFGLIVGLMGVYLKRSSR